jgi:gliding motility-associated-like protein
VPVQIGNDTDWAAITNSFFYVLLLKTDGSLWYYRGEPGGGLSAVPVRMGTSGDWRTVSVGTQFAAALSVLPFDPMPTPVDLGDDIETCNPSVTLTPSIADGGLYKWTLPNGTVVYNRTPPFTFEASASGTYKLAVTKAGCRSSDDIRVTLHSSAPLTLQIDGTPIPGCPGHYDLTQPLTFRNTSPDAGTQPFTWAMGDGTTTNGAQPQYTYGRPGTYTVALSTTTCPRSITRDVVIQHVLSLGDDLVTCMPAISLSAPISGANSYTWVMPTGNTTGETITAAATGIYTLSLVQYGCTQTDALHITFEPSGASGDFTITTLGTPVTEGATILAGVPFTLNGTLPASVPHQWSFDDGGTGNTHSIDHAYTDPGTYAVTLTAGSNHCAGTITKYLHVQDLIITDAISPNGDGKNDRLVITPFIYDAELKIMDRAGRTVYHATPYNNDFSGQNLESDVYYYELQLKEASKSYKGYVHVIK